MKIRRGIWLVSAGVLGILTAVVFSGFISVQTVDGEAMEPEIQKGTHVIINKAAYFSREPQAGDVVVFPCDVYSEDGEGRMLVRRVAAVAGDQVEIKEGSFYVNGRLYDKFAVNPVYMDPMEKVTIGKQKVFVLSDNRSAVLDSRDQAVDQMDIAELTGKVLFK